MPTPRRPRHETHAFVVLLLASSCSFDWDAVDPRLGERGSAGATSGAASAAGDTADPGGAGSGGAGSGQGGTAPSAGTAPSGDGGEPAAGGAPAQATCSNGVMDGEETGKDCGGPDCPACETRDVFLYWVDSQLDRVSRARPVAAAAPETVVDLGVHSSYFLRSLAIDTTLGKIYFSDSSASVIRRSNLDGSNVQNLITGLAQPMSLALDTAGGKVYWADQGATAKIQRANLDGGNVEDLVVDPVVQHPYGLVLDAAKKHIYFIDNDTDKLLRCDLDGANVTDLQIPDLARPIELSLDLAAGKIYWSDLGDSGGPEPSIRRANLDGTNPEPVVTLKNFPSLTIPLGLDLDLANGYVYFVDGGTGGNGVIARANLDGSGATPLIVGLPEARGIKVVAE